MADLIDCLRHPIYDSTNTFTYKVAQLLEADRGNNA